MSTHHHDVVVVGARCAGAATAMLLARLGLDVAVVDKARLPSDTLSTHGIARGGVVQLARWGLLDAVLQSGAPAVRDVSFHSGDLHVTRRIKERAGVDMLVAPRRHRLDALLAEAATEAGAALHTGVCVTGVLRNASGRVSGVRTRAADGSTGQLTARVVVGADGLRSRMAGWLGAEDVERTVSSCSLFYAYVDQVDWQGFEFFTGSNAFAGIFPTHDGQACVWLCRPTSLMVPLLAAGSGRAQAFRKAIAAAVPALTERISGGRLTSPVRGSVNLPNVVRQAVGPGWALVGDAGYHRDPITGHGITDAFRDAELAARAIDAALRDPANETGELATYQRTRDAILRDTFDITQSLTMFPGPDRFAALQMRLSEALEHEADFLGALPIPARELASSAA